jgi:putative methylase
MRKKELAILLSSLEKLQRTKPKLEQYPTPGEIAAEILWKVNQIDNLKGKRVCDLGCGVGTLSIGAALLGARVVGIDVDEESLKIARRNARGIKQVEFLRMDIEDFREEVDIVIMNPPFGKKPFHKDRFFLRKAFEFARVVYSIHSLHAKDFLEKFAKQNGFEPELLWRFNFPIKPLYLWHRKKVFKFKAGLWRFEKKGENI